MDRQARVVRWMFAILIVIGMLQWSASTLAQDSGTPETAAPTTTVEPTGIPTAEPTVAPTDVPQEPTVAAPTQEPAAPTETLAEPTVNPDEPTIAPTEGAAATPGASSRIQALLADGTGVVTARNTSDAPVLDACYTVFVDDGGRQGAYAGQGCDSDDGRDGVTTIGGIQPGAYLLVGSYVPEGFIVGREQQIAVTSGQTTAITFQFANGGRTVRIAKVDDGNNPLPGACFNLRKDLGDGEAGDFVAGNCSNPDATDGFVFIAGVVPGVYVLVETQAPAGFLAGPNQAFTLAAGFGTFSLTVRNAPINSPGNLIITKVNATGTLFVDACFVAFVDTGGQAGECANGTCDWDDGASDGSMVIPSLAPDTLVVRETLAPDGYRFGGEWMVSLPGTGAGATRLGVENVFGGTTVTFNTLGENGAPLGDVCFDVHLDNGSGLATDGSYITSGCTDPDVTLTGFPAGRYILIVYEWPAGYYEPGNILFVVAVGTSDQDVGVQLLPETTIDALIRRLIEILTDILASM